MLMIRVLGKFHTEMKILFFYRRDAKAQRNTGLASTLRLCVFAVILRWVIFNLKVLLL